MGRGIDDKYIFEHISKKIQSEEEYSTVKIEVIDGKNAKN